VPALHPAQEVAPELDAPPEGQGVQVAAPESAEYLLAAHEVHKDETEDDAY